MDVGLLAAFDMPVVETAAIQAVYCTGLARICASNGDIHFVYYIEQPAPDGGMERIVNLRVVMPRDSAIGANMMMTNALYWRGEMRPESAAES